MSETVRVSTDAFEYIRNNKQGKESDKETVDRLLGINQTETPFSKDQMEIIRSICADEAVSQDQLDDRIREIIETEYM